MSEIRIGTRRIGAAHPAYIVAELSANHGHSFDRALELVRQAKMAGADAVKLQTYTADTLTLRSDREWFRIGGGTLWDGRTLYDLYEEAYTPWEWQPRLMEAANELGLDLFSSPFDATAVAFLESMGVPAYKVAAPELVDVPLIEAIARTGKPIIMSAGMATLQEIDEAVVTARRAGAREIALLKCTSAYPAPAHEMNLRTIPDLAQRFGVTVGLSDHTMGTAVPVAAVVLGATMIEKHFTLSRADGGPDSAFSLEPQEFAAMVTAIREAEQALGTVHYGLTPGEVKTRPFRRSLFAVADIKAGETFTPDNVRSVRPAAGLHPRYLDDVLGRQAARDVSRATPLAWDDVVVDEAGKERRRDPAGSPGGDGSFDQGWERDFYAAGQYPRCPYDYVASFVYRNTPSGANRDDVKVLEVGCGSGNNVWFLAQEGYAMTGVDGSASAIAYARERLVHDGLAADLRVADFVSLPFESGRFDLAFDRGALVCVGISQIRKAIAEIHRVLKPGGRFLFNPYSQAATGFRTGTPAEDGQTLGAHQFRLTFLDRQTIDDLFGDQWSIVRLYHGLLADELAGLNALAEWRVEALKK